MTDQSAPPAPEKPRKRILLVDDEDAVRRVAARMLQHIGYDVETAVDGQEALDLMRANPYRCDVVLLDGNMPRMSGAEAARHIRSLRADLPLILASGYFDGGESTASGGVFNGAIGKPYNMASLSSVVASHLRP